MDHVRHSALFNCSQTSITLIGCGGIGSVTALALAKMGVGYLAIIDDQSVGEENLATQLFKLSDVAKSKVAATWRNIEEFSDDTLITPIEARVDGSQTLHNQIVISAVDSITSRQVIWEAIDKTKTDWYLDARMSAEKFMLYSVDMHNYQWYDNFIRSQREEDVPDDVCTMKSTIFTAFIAAGRIGSQVRRIISGQPVPERLHYDIPADDLLLF